MGDAVLGTLATVFFWTYFLILIGGTAMTLIFLLALVRGRKVLAQWPFYKIVWSVTWMDAIYLSVQLFWKFPQMAVDDDGKTDDIHAVLESRIWYNFLLAVLTSIPPKGILYFSLLIALNRLAAFVDTPISPIFSKVHGLFRDYVGLTTVFCWILILILSVYTELLTPVYDFNRTTLRYTIAGPGMIDSKTLLGINTISDYVIPFIIVAIYVAVYLVIGKKRKLLVGSTSSTAFSSTAKSKSTDDRKILFQAVIITFFLQLDNVTRVINAFYDGNDWFEYLINILDLITTVINHSVHATIFLLSNSTIRSFLPAASAIKRRLRCS